MQDILLRLKIETKITYIILGVNVLIWMAMEIAGGSTNTAVLIGFGALNKGYVYAGEVWRIVSSAFLHIGIFHLLVNSYTLYQLGTFVEDFFGRTKLIATYILTAISAGILSLILSSPFNVSAGASGALFGLVGLILGNAWAKKTYVFDLPIDERQLLPFVAYNLVFGFIAPGIDNWAHIGGLVGGILLGFVFDPALSFDPSSVKRILPKVLGILSVAILAITAVFWFLSIWGVNVLIG
ncbi:MAG: rhomboid family intramembrane serine protease [Candidatus Dojkabacteria bacterium]|nr:rhomboid family intramembrane serine protease [Candidatus Dojkabacteria bacterium]